MGRLGEELDALLEAFAVGLLAESSLLLAGLVVRGVPGPKRLVGIIAGFGAGAMIAAIVRAGSRKPGRSPRWSRLQPGQVLR